MAKVTFSGSASRLVNGARQRDTFTEKSMVANSTSLNACVDMYFMAGAAVTGQTNRLKYCSRKRWLKIH